MLRNKLTYAIDIKSASSENVSGLLLVFSLTVKAATLIFISGCGSAKEGKSGFLYNLVKR